MKKQTIDSFCGENFFLSNLYPCKIQYDGLTFECAESAFQASKTQNNAERMKFVGIDGYEARELGKAIELRPDWEEVRTDVMRDIIKAKFEGIPKFGLRLMNTGDAQLTGGKELLDEILMEQRDSLNKAQLLLQKKVMNSVIKHCIEM